MNTSIYQKYSIEPYLGEHINNFIDRLFEQQKLLKSVPMVKLAACISKKIPAASGIFNGVELIININDTIESVLIKYKKQLKKQL